ncbi:cellulose binding domain-containing protein [Terrimicrobium sacchariphilum]|uniref:Endoglucanase n=1 Tax=Terrimicrobium sacchariphilum TaxID=690879 RepID=A0A146GC38_TERSA|nr:glycoside hydrolase family 9 protein [Terrimicrobium sacchariphilum]GAT34732.1 cellulose binding domain-containing protein [Terrimicrobium sacchariphilum]
MFRRLILGFLLVICVLMIGEIFKPLQPRATWRTVNDWGSGVTGEFTIDNPTGQDIDGWTLRFDYPGKIEGISGATVIDQDGTQYLVRPVEWNSVIAPDRSATVELRMSPGGYLPRRVKVDTKRVPASNAEEKPDDIFLLGEPRFGRSTQPEPLAGNGSPALARLRYGAVELIYRVVQDYGHKMESEVLIRNNSWETLRDWTIFLDFPRRITAVQGGTQTAQAGANHRLDSDSVLPIPPKGELRLTLWAEPGLKLDPPRRMLFRARSGSQSRPDFNYAAALQMSLYFYEAQRSGKLGDTRVAWRRDSGLSDGADKGVDLTGGYYDAGDHMKFTFPLSSALSILSWGGLEYRAGYEKAGQWSALLDTVRWGTDWLIKAHVAPNELYAQVGDGRLDHAYWGPPERMTMKRPSYKITVKAPGSDLAGEASAALASASILFLKEDPAYAALLLRHARELYDFAVAFPGSYSDSVPAAKEFYPSRYGYQDEVAWAAAWLYSATGEKRYLDDATAIYKDSIQGRLTGAAACWDDKRPALAVLMARITRKDIYKRDAEQFLDYWTDGRFGPRVRYTPGGLAWHNEWGPLRYAANAAFLAFVYSDRVADYRYMYHRFAKRQINYILGDNPARRSYLVGFGNNPPMNPHHRASHDSPDNDINNPANNAHILYGALVGGPSSLDDFDYEDNRRDVRQNEVALDYNGGLTGALARMVMLNGGKPMAVFPPK